MMCYRDMTFCRFYEDCKHKDNCARPLTPEVLAAAQEWWSPCTGGAPIAQFSTKPNCHEVDDERTDS